MLEELTKIIEKSWAKETCYPSLQDTWSKQNPSLGQCAITALVVNDFLGGKIMRTICDGISHYYNLIDNKVVDLTVDQFKGEIPNYQIGEERTREYLLSSSDTAERYKLLLETVKDNFIRLGTKTYKLVNSNSEIIESKIPGTLGGNKKLKIYGHLDCPSALRHIANGYYIQNRVFFIDEETAINAGYRPCGICMKKEYKKWKELKFEKR